METSKHRFSTGGNSQRPLEQSKLEPIILFYSRGALTDLLILMMEGAFL